jgi:transcriptional regulator with XRE-family HTH domain
MDLGLRQEDPAGQLGLTVAGLAAWEKGQHEPEMARWPTILDFLGYDPHPEPSTLRERLEWMQRHRGWEHRELAARLRVSASTLTRWKAGARPWSRRSIAALRTLLEAHDLPCEGLEPRGGIAEYLVARRLELRLSQGAAAEQIGVSCGTYRGWERHGKEPAAASWPGVLAFLGYDPHPAPTSVAGWLQAGRRLLGLTQAELAARLGVTKGAVQKWEVGLGPGRPRHRAALETFLAAVQWYPFAKDDAEDSEPISPRA